MFAPKVNSKQKRVKNSGLRGKWFTEIVSRFYDQKAPTFCHQNRATFLTTSGQKKQLFQKCVFHNFRPFQGSKSNSNTPNSSY